MGNAARSAFVFMLPLSLLSSGCNNTTSVEREEAARLRTYTGLPNQKIATMVWTDWVIRTEYNRIQYDLAEAVHFGELAAESRVTRDKRTAMVEPLAVAVD